MEKTGNYIRNLPEAIYPIIRGETQVAINPEVMFVKGEAYYFASDFKRKNFLIDELLEKYRPKKTLFGKKRSVKDLYIRNRKLQNGEFEPFDLGKRAEIIDAIEIITNRTGKRSVPIYDVLAYLELSGGSFLLTATWLYSPGMLDEFNRGVKLCGIVRADDDGLFGTDGTCYCREKLPKDFIKLLNELIVLNKETKYMDIQHPMYSEVNDDIKKQYMEFLAWRLCAGDIRACDIIRMEIMARQLQVSSRQLSKMIRQIQEDGQSYRDKEYFDMAIDKTGFDISAYGKVIFCDLAAFDLYGKEKEEENLSFFTQNAVKKMGISDEFKQNYIECLKNPENDAACMQDGITCTMLKFETKLQRNI